MSAKRCRKCGKSSNKKEKICSYCGAKKKPGIFRRFIKYSFLIFAVLVSIGIFIESDRVSKMTPEERAVYEAEKEARAEARAKEKEEAQRIAAVKAEELVKAKEAKRQIAEAEAVEKAKAKEEARKIAEAEAAAKAKAEQEVRKIADREAQEKAAEVERLRKDKADDEASTLAKLKAEQQQIADTFKESGQTPYVRTTGTVTGDYTVDVVIETNIPLDFETGVSLSLIGLADAETAIGTGMKRIKVIGGQAATTIDVRQHWSGSDGFPTGEYELYAKFYPLWTENREIAEMLDIGKDSIGDGTVISMVGNGILAEEIRKQNKAQRWAMDNITIGDVFGAEHHSNLPDLALISRVKKNASVDFLHHYSPLADITVIVNSFTGKVVTWRMGRFTE